MGTRENPIGVWDSFYKGIWHLKEDPADPAPQFQDSTLNNNAGTAFDLSSSNQVDGKIDGSIEFDDLNDRCVNISHHSSLQLSSDISLSAWVNTTDSETDVDVIVAKWGNPILQRNYWLGKIDENYLAFYVNNTEYVTVDLNLINDGKWHYITGVADSSNNLLRFYIDGVEINNSYYTGTSITGASDLLIGRSPGEILQEWNGIIDEVHLSNTVRSSNWIATEYSNQDDPNNFYNIGNESLIIKHPPNANHFNYFKVIQINHTKVNGSTSLTNFPLLINLLDSDLFKYVRTDGNDIKFALDGNWLDHEIELFNKTYDSSHSQLIAWVKIPSLSPFVDSLIIMYYGNTTMTSQESPSDVWDTNYNGIWHLSEDPLGTIYDSTSNNNDGTSNNMTSNDQIKGQIDGSLDFYGKNNYISMGSSINIASSSFTVSTWVKRGSSTSADIIFQQGSDSPNNGFHAGFRSNNKFTFAFWFNDLDTTQTYTETDWHHWSCTYDASTKSRKIYRDGVNIASDTASEHFLGSGPFILGYDDWVNEGFDGQLDEPRLLNIALSSEWIATEYNNQ
ncbi:MAG: DUF2341 domain-containing protein, partial [Promethearchaeota archaeon]